MNMKRRLFMSKHRKKKSFEGDATTTTESSRLSSSSTSTATNVDENAQKSSSKRKLFRKNKSKGQKPVGHQGSSVSSSAVVSGKVFESRPSPNVVLRRATKLDDIHNVPITTRRVLDQRIPGSVSSSRTASSASSSSSRRWSSRRPWSLVETMQNPSSTEYVRYDGDISDQASSSVSLNRAKTSEDELTASDKENGRNKGFISDLFTRRFKRSSSGTNSIQPSSDERSIRLKTFKKNKESLNNRRSWHLPSHIYSVENSGNDFPKPFNKDLNIHLSRSYTDPPRFRKGEKTQYGRYSAPNPTDPFMSGSHSSVSTVVSTKNRYSKDSSDSQDIPQYFSEPMSNRSSVQSTFSDLSGTSTCAKCLPYKDNVKRNVCYCSSAPLTSGTSLDGDSSLFRSTTSSLGRASQNSLADSPIPIGLNHFLSSGDTVDDFDKDNDHDLKKSVPKGQSKLGGSLIDLSKFSPVRWSDEYECTLTRRNVNKRDSKLDSTKKNSPLFASSPQLNTLNFQVTKKWKKTLKIQEDSPSTQSTGSSIDSAVVDSPIKRAIGFPGVVLRRHRQLKNANETQSFPKSASANSLSRQFREKQVFSLNLEDLPTYGREKSPNDLDAKTKAEDGRELSSFAILYQRLLTQGLSSDSAKDVDSNALNNEDLINLLLMPGIHVSGRNNEKSGQNQVCGFMHACLFISNSVSFT